MAKPVFDQIQDAVKQGSWNAEVAKQFGFDFIASAEITDHVYQAIVIGAGPSGFGFVKQAIDLGCAHPKNDTPPILVLEGGEKMGTKSVYGGAFWPNDPVIFDKEPQFFDDCPYDRIVTKKSDHLYLVNKDGKQFKPPLEPATLFRNRSKGYITPKNILYPYFWSKIEKKKEEGYFKIRSGQSVEKLILNEVGKVVGVSTYTGQKYFSVVVVDASGCGATFSKNLAYRELNNYQGDFFFGIKLVCELENNKINAAFGLKEDKDGCVLELAGNISDKIDALPGIVGIYPGDGIVNVSILYNPQYGIETGLQPHEIMNEVLQHPAVKKVTDGSKPVEWSACRLPELHFKYMPKFSYDGYLPVGDTLGLVDFLRKHGVNTGMKSGAVAAEAFDAIVKKGQGFQGLPMQVYDQLLKSSWVGKRLMGSVFKTIHKVIHMPLFYRAMKWHSSLGATKNTGANGLAPMSHSDYMALNAEPEGQPEILIKNMNVCASCASESCLTSDPCQAFALNRKGLPVLDVDPVIRPEVKATQKTLSLFRMINAEGCLECGNCESGCSENNVIYRVPGNTKGKQGHKNKGITYRYN